MTAFYESQGFMLGEKPDKIHKKLRRLMGNDRYERYLDVATAKNAGDAAQEDHYSTVQTLAEANCLMSFQSEVMIESHRCLLKLVKPVLTPQATIVELGCWTGVFASWIAHEHPDVSVVGVDRLALMVKAAVDQGVPQNCALIAEDYSQPFEWPFNRADLVVSALGIDFDQVGRDMWPVDISRLRDSLSFEERKRESHRYLTAVNKMSDARAKARFILRIPTFDHYAAFVAGAEEAGWGLDPLPIKHLCSGEESFHVVSLERRAGFDVPASLEVLASEWGDISAATAAELLSRPTYQIFNDARSLALYLSLDKRTKTDFRDNTYDDGHTMIEEIGTWSGGEYLFARATNGFMSLQVCPAGESSRLVSHFD
jgi:hypothetical protein